MEQLPNSFWHYPPPFSYSCFLRPSPKQTPGTQALSQALLLGTPIEDDRFHNVPITISAQEPTALILHRL